MRADRSFERARRLPIAAAALLLCVASAAYFYRVGDVPSASGDEGNWMSLGHRIYVGLPTRLAPDARFVTLAFARMIALSYRLAGGVSIGAARAVLGASLLVGLALVLALTWRMRVPRAGAAVVGVLALHPWTVCWARSVVVPYPIALVTAVLGPLAWLHATGAYGDADARAGGWRRHLGLVLAGQVLVSGMHFTPFALIPMLACALWSIASADGRRSLRTPGPWLALGGALAHAAPVLWDAFSVLQGAGPARRTEEFGPRWRNLVRTILDGYSGEQTLRDYVGDNAHAPLGLTPSRALVLATLGASLWMALRPRRARDGIAGPAEDALRRFAPLYLITALLTFPLVLAPARDWWLATIDAERYLFALLAPGALLVAAATARGPAAALLLPAALCGYFALGPDLRTARYFWRGGGPDHGYFSAHRGGGFRGYKVAAGPRSVTRAIHEACRDEARGGDMVIAFDDYAFHPVRVLIRARPDANLRSSYLRDAAFSVGQRLCIPVWPEAMFAPGHIPGHAVEHNRWARDYALRRMDAPRRIAAWTQPNGAPLVELYVGRVSAAEAGHQPR